MIVSENITLDITSPFDSNDIESMLSAKGIEPLRWAIIEVLEQKTVLNVSYVKES